MTGIPNLVGFCEAIMEYWPEGAPDGGDLQDMAIKHGLLREETRHAFCDADEDADAGACACREICDIHDLKRGFTCCTRVPLTPPSAPAARPEVMEVTEEISNALEWIRACAIRCPSDGALRNNLETAASRIESALTAALKGKYDSP